AQDQVIITQEEEATRGFLRDESVSIKPQLGAVFFEDATGDRTTRAAAGLTLDINVAPGSDSWFIGPSTGAIFSHLGSATSNFFGTSPGEDASDVASGGANMLQVPANVKVGYNFTDKFRLAIHGGGNVIYRSEAGAISLGDSITGSDWTVFPNVGA